MYTVLIIESNLNQRKLYVQELEEEGYQVVVAVNGQVALDLIQSGKVKPDIIVLGIYTPGKPKNGLETLNKLLAYDKKLPVILNSAYSCYRDNFKSLGAKDYILKSSDLTELKNAIRRALRRRSRH